MQGHTQAIMHVTEHTFATIRFLKRPEDICLDSVMQALKGCMLINCSYLYLSRIGYFELFQQISVF